MTKHKIPKDDEEALQDLLDDIESKVRDEYWSGEWSQTGCEVTWYTAQHFGQ